MYTFASTIPTMVVTQPGYYPEWSAMHSERSSPTYPERCSSCWLYQPGPKCPRCGTAHKAG